MSIRTLRSVRLDDNLEARLKEAAQIAGEPVSNIIREAIEQRCEHILGKVLSHRLADVTGTVHSSVRRAKHTGKAFVKSLKAKRGGRP